MEPRSEELEVKRYRCYLCSASSEERGLPLLSTKTSFSRVWLGVKLHEIVGDNFVVILSTKDAICWDCASCINKIDKYEMRLDEEKDRLMNCIQKKYKSKEIDLTGYYKHREMEKTLLQRNSDDSLHDAAVDHSERDSGKKPFVCPVCHRSFATAAAVGVHKARQHPTMFLCEKCDLPFTTEIKYRQHLLRHNLTTVTKRRPANAKRLSCISCGFETTNTEAYCRHVCDSTIASMACTNCGRRFLSKKVNGKHECMCSDCQKIEEELNTMESESAVDAVTTTASVANTTAMTTTQAECTENFKEEPVADSTTDLADLDLVQPGETVIPADPNEEPPPPPPPPQPQEQAMDVADGLTLIKCTNCEEVFEFNQVVTHPCFINGQTTEFAQVTTKEDDVPVVQTPSSSNPNVDSFLGINDSVRSEVTISPSHPTVSSQNKYYRRRIPRIPAQENTFIPSVVDPSTRMICKTCCAEFRSIELMRQHWEITGHAPEIFTTTIELNKIRDKASKTEQTFKVVKQNFSIRANVVGQNDEDIRKQDETYYDCIVKIKDTPSIEEFNLQNGIPCETCDVVFGDADLLAEHQRTNCLTCVTCNVTFLDNKLLNKHYQYTGHATKKFKKQFTNLAMSDSSVTTGFMLDEVQHVVVNICEQCNLEFVDKDSLQEHVLRFHNPLIVFNCDQCEAVFESAIARAEHVGSVHVVQQLAPPTESLQVPVHVESDQPHGGVRRRRRRRKKSNVEMYKSGSSYVCPRCNVTLQTARAFAVHFQRHRTPYVCCRRRFRDTSLLAIHRRALHPKSRPYRCPLCSSIYSVPAALTCHLKKKHRTASSRSLFRCKTCRRLYGSSRKFSSHLLAHAKRNDSGFLLLPSDGSAQSTLKWPILEEITGKTPSFKKLGPLPLNATDEDILQAADTLIADGRIMLSEYSRDVREVTDSDAANGNKVILTSEVIIENSDEFFDDL